jgi:hypothetical protein
VTGTGGGTALQANGPAMFSNITTISYGGAALLIGRRDPDGDLRARSACRTARRPRAEDRRTMLDGRYRAYAAHHKRLVPLVW